MLSKVIKNCSTCAKRKLQAYEPKIKRDNYKSEGSGIWESISVDLTGYVYCSTGRSMATRRTTSPISSRSSPLASVRAPVARWSSRRVAIRTIIWSSTTKIDQLIFHFVNKYFEFLKFSSQKPCEYQPNRRKTMMPSQPTM